MLCDLALRFPPFAADFLGRGHTLRRRFREETITDMLMGSLLAIGGRHILVDFPDEPATGADMQWDFVNEDSGAFYRLLIQAKMLSGESQRWQWLQYAHLLHKTAGALQAETL